MRTTFYSQKGQALAQGEGEGEGFNAGGEPEKIHTLIPEAYRNTANNKDDVLNLGEKRSTFFSQQSTPDNAANVQFDAGIEPEKIHTLIPEAYRNSANDKEDLLNLGEKRSTFYA